MSDPRETFYKQMGVLERIVESGIYEVAYEGNIGLHELMQFYFKASEDQKEQLESLLKSNQTDQAWSLIQQVTGTKLKGLSSNIGV